MELEQLQFVLSLKGAEKMQWNSLISALDMQMIPL